MDHSEIIAKLEEKLKPSVEKLQTDNADEHDFLPALLWTLLRYDKRLQEEVVVLRKKMEIANSELAKLEETQKSTTEDVKNSLQQETVQLREELEMINSELPKLVETQKSTTEDVKNSLQQEVVQLREELLQQKTTLQNIARSTNRKSNWLIFLSIFQFVLILTLGLLLFIR
ncbi:hypothetical protein QUF80_07625 [Desulfococcaceae bacterium HSG8]|nr:hypothetical protein [Desulfococcaceae bacterium HSG8]